MFHVFLDFSDINFQVFIPFKFRLHGNNIFCVANLPVVYSLEILLELVKLRTELLTLSLDTSQALLTICIGGNRKFTLHFFQFGSLLPTKCR